MTIEERAEMPTCNLAETVHNKWLQQSGNKMTCLYEATVDDMIRAFMQIANYRTWLKGGSDGKGPDSASLKLKAAARCGDPKMLADAMKSYPGAEDVNTRDCALEGSELFGSTKRKLNLPPGADCDSHRPDKVNYSIPRPNTRATRQRIEESLSSAIHGVAHTTSVLETDCLASKWHIARLPPNSAKRCWALQAITGTMCNAKVGTGKHGTPAPTYKGLRKEFRSPNNVEYEFWFCPDDIKRCVSGSKKKYVLDWPVVPNTWPVKIGTNLSKEEVLALEDAGFQLQQREALSPRRRLSTIATLPIPRSHFSMPPNPDAHPTFRFGKTVRRNPAAPLADHKNKWESAGLMDGYYVVGVTAIPYPGFGVIINIVSKQDITYHVTIGDIPHCTCPDFTKMSSHALGKKGKWVYCKHLYYVFRFLCKVDYESDKFIHAPTYTYNEVMRLLELAGIIECE